LVGRYVLGLDGADLRPFSKPGARHMAVGSSARRAFELAAAGDQTEVRDVFSRVDFA